MSFLSLMRKLDPCKFIGYHIAWVGLTQSGAPDIAKLIVKEHLDPEATWDDF